MNKKPALVSVIIVIAGVLAVFLYKTKIDRHSTLSIPSAVTLPTASAASTPPMMHGVIYTLSSDAPAGANGLVAHSIELTHPDSPAKDALNALAAAPNSPLPSGTTLRGVTIRDGLATVDFSPEFKSNFPGGDTRETQTITAIRETLGQFSEVQNVQILVAGKPIDTLGGMLDLSSPLPVTRMGTTQTARGN